MIRKINMVKIERYGVCCIILISILWELKYSFGTKQKRIKRIKLRIEIGNVSKKLHSDQSDKKTVGGHQWFTSSMEIKL